ncbi:MAG: hypothetical protein LBC86_09875 [Oscillospiraceae bacterium]|nr:hypothetical protein [Oscillospiraceae bacterium]
MLASRKATGWLKLEEDNFMPKEQYTIRIDEHLLEKTKIIASKQVRSINNQFEFFVTRGIELYEKENGEINLSEE